VKPYSIEHMTSRPEKAANRDKHHITAPRLFAPLCTCPATQRMLPCSCDSGHITACTSPLCTTMTRTPDEAAGNRIAAACRAPEGYTAHVVGGAAAGLAHATAACLTGSDHAKVRALPDTSKFERRVVLLDEAGDSRWDAAIALTGARLRRVGVNDRDALRKECARPDVCCFIWFDGYNESPTAPSIAELCHIAHTARGPHGDPVPVIVDAASRLPPVSNLWTITQAGADCAVFSGGKAMRGPQTSGIMIGRRELIRNARANGSPNEAAVCRPMKTSKEVVVGCVAALERFVEDEIDSAARAGG
jgi:seryl-tRNA(Sec) selenium transferase